MDTLFKSDIFFLVSISSVILVAGAILLVMFYLIRIMMDIRSISKVFSKEVRGLIMKLTNVSEIFNGKGVYALEIVKMIFEYFKNSKGKKRATKKVTLSDENEE